jgi:hypothetical protein
LHQQDAATSEISKNASDSEYGLSSVVKMLTAVTDDALRTGGSAKKALSASNALEATSTTLRDDLERSLRKATT